MLKIIDVARALAAQSDHDQHKLSALLLDSKGRIVNYGINHLTKTHPKFHRINKLKTLHAEAALLYSTPLTTKRLGKHSIFIFRSHKDGTLANARPCEDCMKVIKQYGIKSIVYTKDGTINFESI